MDVAQTDSDVTAGATRLRSFRVARRLSQEELAKLIGVDQARVSNFETGTRRPGLPLAARIERVTGIPAILWVDESELPQHIANRAPSSRSSDGEIERQSRRAS